ncbi:MAG: 2-oxoacid:acceptor oxidoreductase subunit alpha [Candidatus Pacebacteria bacterium CG_4_10_14_0_8_um_filter_42_14]|nr:MAG: 2-oxoacid:acceptor oxidoreductase subunit alpha [Candidatus Pacebacteria bacterium CG_4_10_14_0_8_um_filter_42_14]
MAQKSLLWKTGGPAGQGVMTTGLSMSKLAARSGAYVFDYAEYPSLVQGGHNTYEVLIRDTQPTASAWTIDCLVCLNEETFELHQHRLDEKSLVVYDPADFNPEDTVATTLALPLKELLAELKANTIMINMIALGASWALLSGNKTILETLITEQFERKGTEVVEQNSACALTGYDYVLKHFQKHMKNFAWKTDSRPQAVLTGNDAFSLGAAAADCKFYAAYPMTPASSVLSTLAAWQPQTQMVVRHAEDEVGVVSEALGASFAGVRSCVGTSGGGFALMTESLSYAGIAEIPLVLFLSQRPGPATGLPTWTEQGDLLFAAHAGHGDFPKIILAPGDQEEMVELTQTAFDLADVYQTPVIVMSDKFLSESHASVSLDSIERIVSRVQNRGKTTTETHENYLRYQVTDDGISPRLIPGSPGTFYQANSYEHSEDSHTTEDAEDRTNQTEKRARKLATFIEKDYEPCAVYGDLEDAEIIFVSWGSTKGPVFMAREMLEMKTSHLHFSNVYPLDEEALKNYFKHNGEYVLVENNMNGQFGQLLRQQTGINIERKILKYDGRAFYPEEIVAAILQQQGEAS